MSAVSAGDETMRRAAWIASRSRIAAVADVVIRRTVASVDSSRALVLARRRLREFQSLPPGERTRCGLIVLAAALAGHVLLAAMLPPPARPSVALTTVAFLGAALALAAAAPRIQ